MFAVDLAEQIRSQNEGTSLSTYLIILIHEIEEDRDTLVTVMERLGVERNPVKEAAGWVAEKVSRLKFQVPVGVDAQVSRLLEVDTLLTGLFGKQALWQILGKVSAAEPRLTEFDFDALEARVAKQIEALNGYRLETFTGIFAE
ncbi:MAG: hypothetical protein M3024_14605 [Candidatus Dormibacteraeota bacterium]|nr:hypothetical protein [Candidatus Dormibacteraeota bacterium]